MRAKWGDLHRFLEIRSWEAISGLVDHCSIVSVSVGVVSGRVERPKTASGVGSRSGTVSMGDIGELDSDVSPEFRTASARWRMRAVTGFSADNL